MEQIRITRGIEVNVNDNGDTIVIEAENNEFLKRYRTLLDNIQKIAEDLGAKTGENLSESEQFDAVYDTSTKLMTEVNNLFGSDACHKIFGDITPSIYAFTEFFEQMTPIVERYAEKRNKEIGQRYNPNRRGGKR